MLSENQVRLAIVGHVFLDIVYALCELNVLVPLEIPRLIENIEVAIETASQQKVIELVSRKNRVASGLFEVRSGEGLRVNHMQFVALTTR